MWMAKGVCMNMGVCMCMCMHMSMREDASAGVNADASVGVSTEGTGTRVYRVMRGHGWHGCGGRTRPSTCTRRTGAARRRRAVPDERSTGRWRAGAGPGPVGMAHKVSCSCGRRYCCVGVPALSAQVRVWAWVVEVASKFFRRKSAGVVRGRVHELVQFGDVKKKSRDSSSKSSSSRSRSVAA